MEGQIVTIINRSEIVGRPLAAMLANDGAQVYSVDVDSIYLLLGSAGRMHACDPTDTVESCIRKSTIIVTGVPSKSYRLPIEWIQPNTAVINVSSYKNVHELALATIPGVVYAPMVGKVTVAMLERNLMRLYHNFHDPFNSVKKQQREESATSVPQETVQSSKISSYFNNTLQIYTAGIVTALLLLSLSNKKR
jgi:methylenetetrahydrofolate dehydrogenase (NAD+)